MTDDYLLQEFHEAGIWLPEERILAEFEDWRSRGYSINGAAAMVRLTICRDGLAKLIGAL